MEETPQDCRLGMKWIGRIQKRVGRRAVSATNISKETVAPKMIESPQKEAFHADS
jgi:hypothetical protein